MSTSARAWSTLVWGSTPWPRLKIWPGRGGSLLQHVAGPQPQLIEVGHQRQRVQVPLHPIFRPDQLPGVVQPQPPVDPDHIRVRLGQQRQQRRIASGKVDHRRAFNGADDRLDVGQHEAAIVVGTKAAGPGVEQLDDLRPGPNLGVQVDRHRAGQPLHQRPPSAFVAVHQGLGMQIIAARAALDGVAGQA